ncbi:MAG: 50S ribosomal protein L21 [Candidatus Dormibacteria bacterium]
MYAIVQVGGRQYRAAPGVRLVVDRMAVEPGSRVQLADVRMLVAEEGDGEAATQVGRPRLEGVSVAARAIGHLRGPKLLVFKYKPKKRYRRRQGFRAELTELRIEEVRLGAYAPDPEAKEAVAAPRSRTATAASPAGRARRPRAAVGSARTATAGTAPAPRRPAEPAKPAPGKAETPARRRSPRAADPAPAKAAAPPQPEAPKRRASKSVRGKAEQGPPGPGTARRAGSRPRKSDDGT